MGIERPRSGEQLLASEYQTTIDSALGKIMSNDEYRHHPHTTPYEYGFSHGERELAYIGTAHSVDPTHLELSLIRERLTDFIHRHGASALVIIEGGEIPAANDEQEAIQNGEMAFTRHLAEQARCEWQSPDPSRALILSELEKKGFSKDDIATWYTLLQVTWSMNTKGEKITMESLGRLAFRLEQLIGQGWVAFPPRQGLIDLHDQNPVGFKNLAEDFGKQFLVRFAKEFERVSGGRDIHAKGAVLAADDAGFDSSVVSVYVDPSDSSDVHAVTNTIGAAFNLFRDREVTKYIGESLAKGRNILTIFGSSHAVMQEPAIREIWEKIIEKK